MNINGQEITTQEQLEELLIGLDEGSKASLRAMFLGTPLEGIGYINDVTPRQIRLALLNVGITEDMIDSVINSLASPTKEAAMITWKHSAMFQRNNAMVPVIGIMLNYNSQQLDNLWITAYTL